MNAFLRNSGWKMHTAQSTNARTQPLNWVQMVSHVFAYHNFKFTRFSFHFAGWQGTVWKPAVLTLWASFEDILQHIHFQQQEVVRTTLLVLWSYISYKFFSARRRHQWDLWFGGTHWCFTIPDAFSTPPGEQISGKVGKEHLKGYVQCHMPVQFYYSHEIVINF